jgi:cytochrome c oxidase subunit 2
LIVPDDQLKPGQYRLLEVDNRVVVPVNTNVRVLLTASDVLHAWAVPAFGVKTDTVPGRLSETWFRATRTGTFYGQCSELCGVNHGFMPIAIDVVSKADFAKWVAAKKKTAAIKAPVGNIELASRADVSARGN